MSTKGYIIDPHSAISVTAALRAAKAAPGVDSVALSTAHPAKFSHAVEREGEGISVQRCLALAICWTKGSSKKTYACTEALRVGRHKDDYRERGEQGVK